MSTFERGFITEVPVVFSRTSQSTRALVRFRTLGNTRIVRSDHIGADRIEPECNSSQRARGTLDHVLTFSQASY